ncbi:MAG: hypothetical protein COV44_11820 [Deltaproteobacteria bacterium CG11_big_fil_rev_8_21_14_0_20_45_16]|nr:MAG: hypothetical protein COV44_11820 [Deltaproteobacteria bacterium CG11_big_fil_rev_8_21_14_0_20_45_16]
MRSLNTAKISFTVAQKIWASLSTEDKQQVLKLLESYSQILKSRLSRVDKLRKIQEITWRFPDQELLKRIFKMALEKAGWLKREGWEKRSLPAKFALAGAYAGLSFVGLAGAGIASGGLAVGLPVFLLTSAGAGLVGIILNELQTEVQMKTGGQVDE